MRKNLFILIIVFAFASGCFQDSTFRNSDKEAKKLIDLNENRIQEIDSLVESLIDRRISAGASLGIQVGKSLPVLKTYGLADIDNGDNVEVDKLFRIASITKIFTATAIAKLVEDKQLSFNDKIEDFFPNFPNGDSINIYHLLSPPILLGFQIGMK